MTKVNHVDNRDETYKAKKSETFENLLIFFGLLTDYKKAKAETSFDRILIS